MKRNALTLDQFHVLKILSVDLVLFHDLGFEVSLLVTFQLVELFVSSRAVFDVALVDVWSVMALHVLH